MPGYEQDLAFIHDVGYTEFARDAAPTLLRLIAQSRRLTGLVVDLGCGSGVWAQEVVAAGYGVLGVDISPAMIRLARRKVPQGRFLVSSLLSVVIPRCVAVTSIGECLNYCFDPANRRASLTALFRRVYEALDSGGLFAFDVAVPSGVGTATRRRGYWEGEDWLVCMESREQRRILIREITCFRRQRSAWRRSEETHKLRLYEAQDLQEELERVGFKVRLMAGYGRARLPAAHVAFVARKPR